jgi:predicted nucleic acid-binding protein
MLLDSNILIYAAKEPTPEIEAMVTSAENAVASVVQIEVYGFPGLQAEEKAALDVLFRRLTVHPLDAMVIEQAITLRQQRKMGLADAIIAATALVHDLPLVTRNAGDFKPVAGLTLIKYKNTECPVVVLRSSDRLPVYSFMGSVKPSDKPTFALKPGDVVLLGVDAW